MCDAPISADDGTPWVAVCTLERVVAHGIVCAAAAGVGLLIIADGGHLYACERACPHEQADLSLGHVAGGQLHCPRHRASFDLADGNISPGWPSRALRRYPVRVAAGQVWVDAAAISAA